MAQYQALVEYKRIAKGTTSVHNMKEFVYVGMKNVQLAKGKIKSNAVAITCHKKKSSFV